jgi:hypothetical protein
VLTVTGVRCGAHPANLRKGNYRRAVKTEVALVNNNENTSVVVSGVATGYSCKGGDCLESLMKIAGPRLMQRNTSSRPGENIKAGNKRQTSRNKTLWNRNMLRVRPGGSGAARTRRCSGVGEEIACRSLLIPRLDGRGGGRMPQRGIVGACRSLLICAAAPPARVLRPAGFVVAACRSLLNPRAHFGAAGAAGALALAAGRLPLAGAVGSSCA